VAFVNEYISQEDKEKYELDELWASYHDVSSQKLPHKKGWTIDREREIWLLDTGRIPDINRDHAYLPERIWTFYYQGEKIEFRIKVSDTKEVDGVTYNIVWDLLSLSPDSLDNLSTKEMINLLDEGLKTYGYLGIAIQRENFRVALIDSRREK